MPSGGSHLRKAQSVRNHVSNQISLGMTNKEIVEANNGTVSSSFVTQQRQRDEAEALGLEEYMLVRGRPPSIYGESLQTVIDFLTNNPPAYIDEICDVFAEEHGLFINVSTVGKWLKRLKYIYKKISKVNVRRDKELINYFLAVITRYSAEQIVALDESAANERTSDRKYG